MLIKINFSKGILNKAKKRENTFNIIINYLILKI